LVWEVYEERENPRPVEGEEGGIGGRGEWRWGYYGKTDADKRRA
jgi:hypothetical protein